MTALRIYGVIHPTGNFDEPCVVRCIHKPCKFEAVAPNLFAAQAIARAHDLEHHEGADPDTAKDL